MSTQNNIKVTFPFFPILFLIFLTLKLCGVINWSYWWVFAPLWIPFVGGFCFFAFFFYGWNL